MKQDFQTRQNNKTEANKNLLFAKLETFQTPEKNPI